MVPLGSGTFTLLKAKLSLKIDASASFAFKDSSLDESRLFSLEQLLDKDIWICKNHDFHVSLLLFPRW